MHEQCVTADKKLSDESLELFNALGNGTLSAEEAPRKFEELRKSTRAGKESALKQCDKALN